MQSMFGLSEPPVKIVEPFHELDLHVGWEAKGANLNSQESDIPPP